MSRERIEVDIQAITGEKWNAARSQALSERVDEYMRHGLCAGADLKHRKHLREGISG